MPNRILRESICKSRSINNLTSFEETLFYRLIVICDDYGRYDADAKILKGYLFPLKDVTASQIEKALWSLVREEMVQIYESNGQPYLQLLNWEKYQNVRNQKSKYPKPPETASKSNKLSAIENNCEQLQANVPVIQSVSLSVSESSLSSETDARSASKSGSERASDRKNTEKAEKATELSEKPNVIMQWFSEFWEIYPKKQAMGEAEEAWLRLNPTAEVHTQILETLRKAVSCDEWQKENGRFIPHPAKWLEQKRWKDEITPTIQQHTPIYETTKEVPKNELTPEEMAEFERLEAELSETPEQKRIREWREKNGS